MSLQGQILTKDFPSFPQFFETNARMTLPVGHDLFLPNLSNSPHNHYPIIHLSTASGANTVVK
jgi:hypothetical protein